MKAIAYHTYGPPAVLRLEEFDTPVPRDNEMLIRVRAASVTSTDSAMRRGKPFLARMAAGIVRPKNPVLGAELAGEIESIGKGVTKFRIGDQVFGASGAEAGAHAEYICLPQDGALAPKPTNLTFEESAAVTEGGLTALPFLRDLGRIQSGDRVLINGASGAVGTAAVQLARYFGAEVTGVTSTANVELVKSLGAEKIIDYTRADFTRSGEKYDIVFDAVGKSSYMRCKDLLTPNGVYLTTVPTLAILLQMLWTSRIGSKRAAIAFTGLRSAGEKTRDLLLLKELAERGEIRPVIDRCYPFSQLAEAHQYVDGGHKRGNVIVSLG